MSSIRTARAASGPAAAVEPAAAATLADGFETDRPARPLTGRSRRVVGALATVLSLYALYWVVGYVETHVYRITFLLGALVLTFLHYPATRGGSNRTAPVDWLLAAAAVAALGWPLADMDEFVYRAASPLVTDLICGGLTLLLVLEATRRTVGWVLPACATLFLGYGYFGPWLDSIGLSVVAHRGYDTSRLIGSLYLTLEGVFGIPLDVAATYIILFTIYGAVLQHSGAGTFFLEWSMAAMRGTSAGASPARATTLASVLLGTVSGSGVATTVTLGSVAWPMLKRAGYSAESAGAVLSAGGIGAIVMPPTLGAAAFLIAEFLKIGYVQVLAMALLPALLYYLSVFLMIEADARRLHAGPGETAAPGFLALTRRGGYHFVSLVTMVALLVAGYTAFRSVFAAIAVCILTSFAPGATPLTPRRLQRALRDGAMGVLPIAATTAAAGIIVGVVTLTGLGLKMAGLIVALAAGQVLLTAAYSAVAVLIVGLAVPVTASYIIAAVMIAPALTGAGVAPVAAHMFIFYYAVLSEVSPPTALSPYAAAAITGGDPLRTMLQTWKYALPAFLVPFAFTLGGSGMGLLLQAPATEVLAAVISATLGVAAIAGGISGWLVVTLRPALRAAALIAGLVLLFT